MVNETGSVIQEGLGGFADRAALRSVHPGCCAGAGIPREGTASTQREVRARRAVKRRADLELLVHHYGGKCSRTECPRGDPPTPHGPSTTRAERGKSAPQ